MNEERTNLVYSIGCGAVSFLFIIGIIVLYIILSRAPIQPIESRAVGYIIGHVEEFKDEFSEMGFEARVAYTLGDRKKKYNPADIGLQEKMGHQGRGILILENEKEEYVFDVGFDYCNIRLDEFTKVLMSKNPEKKVLGLKKGIFDYYPIHVSLYGQKIAAMYSVAPKNNYNVDFTEFDITYGRERLFDEQIKLHISAEELREIYERCIDLQEKLVELYEARM